jgi:hypothetical protein
MNEETPGGLPNVVLGVVYGVMLAGTLVVAGGVMIANAMACDSGGDNCANGVIIATLTWLFISFVLPVAALVWGLVSSRLTRTGRRNRVFALISIIILPVVGLAANLVILFNPAFH